MPSVNPSCVPQPWDLVQMDYASGLPEVLPGEAGFLVAVDCYTGNVIAQPVGAMTSEVSVRFLVEFMLFKYGLT